MKKHLLHTLFAAGVLFCGTSATASHESTLAYEAQMLACLASELEDSFTQQLRETHSRCPASHAELRFRESLCQLSAVATQFRCAVDRCSPACELVRNFECLQETFRCAESSSSCVRLSSCMVGLMQRLGRSMDCVQEAAFRLASGNGGEIDPRDYRGNGEGTHAGNGWFRVPACHGVPFFFREPMR